MSCILPVILSTTFCVTKHEKGCAYISRSISLALTNHMLGVASLKPRLRQVIPHWWTSTCIFILRSSRVRFVLVPHNIPYKFYAAGTRVLPGMLGIYPHSYLCSGHNSQFIAVLVFGNYGQEEGKRKSEIYSCCLGIIRV